MVPSQSDIKKSPELKRAFGFWPVFALSVGAMIGTGMFLGSALGAKYAGNVSLLSWIILALLSVYIAACFGELVAMFPTAGGIYEYSKRAYGRFPSFLIGWVAWLQMSITTTLLVVAAIDYLTPAQFPLLFKILLAVGFIVGLNIIAYIGLEASAAAVLGFAAITFAVIISVIVAGFFHIDWNNFSPFLTHPATYSFIAMFFIVETFFGWEAATYLAEETKEPEKTIPKALIWAALVTALLSIGVAVVMLGIIKWDILAQVSAPFNSAAFLLFGSAGVFLVTIGVYLVLLGSAAGGIISAPRLLLALARDKLFPSQFSAVHERFKTPYKAIIFQALVAIIVIALGFGRYETLLAILVPLAIIMYIFALLSVTVLRRTEPDRHRPFKVPFGEVGPVIVSLIFIGIIIFWALNSGNILLLANSLLLIIIGIPIYFLLEMYYDPKMIIRVNNALAHITLWTEGIALPKSVRRELISHLGALKGKKVLEFGCNVGTFTEHLAQAVGPKGKVYATNASKRELELARRRLQQKGHSHVALVLEKDREGIHSSVPDVNLAVSVGSLGYVQNAEQLLKHINKRLDKGEKIFFVEYDNFFHLIPNTPWLSSDEKIKGIFSRAGFSVKIMRKNAAMWQYIYISGEKERNVKNEAKQKDIKSETKQKNIKR